MQDLLTTFEDYLQNNLPQSQTFHPHFESALGEMLKQRTESKIQKIRKE